MFISPIPNFSHVIKLGPMIDNQTLLKQAIRFSDFWLELEAYNTLHKVNFSKEEWEDLIRNYIYQETEEVAIPITWADGEVIFFYRQQGQLCLGTKIR